MLSLCYLPEVGKMTVSVIKARDLRAKDKFGGSSGNGVLKRVTHTPLL